MSLPRVRRALTVLLLLAPLVARAQTPAPRPSDVSSIDGIVTALYATISGPPGQPRDWDRFFSLMHPQSRLAPTGCPPSGACVVRVWTPQEYRQRQDSALTAIGFREIALVNRVERYGNVAHVFSSYASYRLQETTPFSRGINSIQLFWDGSRWWIFSIYWDSERPGNPLPKAFEGAQP